MMSMWMSLSTTTLRSLPVHSYTMFPKMTPVSVLLTLMLARTCFVSCGASV